MKQILLTQSKVALIDDEDFDRVSEHKWYASFESRYTKWYAKRRTKKSEKNICYSVHLKMHHFVLGIFPKDLNGMVVDHINGESLDNRKSNLEIITQEENMRRSSKWNKKKVDDPSDLKRF